MDKDFLKENAICLGEIYREHGIKGELKFFIYHENGEGLKKKKTYYVELDSGEIKTLTLSQIRETPKFLLVKFKEIQYRDQAEALRKSKIWIEKKDLSKLDDDEFYLSDIIGFEVDHQDRGHIGKLVGFEEGGQILFLIEEDEKKYLVPYIKDWVSKIDFDSQKIILTCPPELFEL